MTSEELIGNINDILIKKRDELDSKAWWAIYITFAMIEKVVDLHKEESTAVNDVLKTILTDAYELNVGPRSNDATVFRDR